MHLRERKRKKKKESPAAAAAEEEGKRVKYHRPLRPSDRTGKARGDVGPLLTHTFDGEGCVTHIRELRRRCEFREKNDGQSLCQSLTALIIYLGRFLPEPKFPNSNGPAIRPCMDLY